MTSFGSGRYEVVEELGAGGMGRVYVVRIAATGSRAALKSLWPHLADDATQLERFRREATAMGAIEHPHLTRCVDFAVEADGTAFLVMELLDGRSLQQIVESEGSLDGERAARIGAQIASALDAAHAHGVIHRDIKPSNVIIVRGYDGGELAKLIDFGVAAIKESPEYARLTRTGQVLGTPNYMAPEQLMGKPVDARTDVYGLGALLYAVLAARPPYPGSTMAEVVTPLLAGDRPPLRVLRPDVGPLAMIVERALSLDPTARFSTARELGAALARVAPRARDAAAVPMAAPPSAPPPSAPPSVRPSRESRPPEPRSITPRRVVTTALASLAVGIAVAAIAILASGKSDEVVAEQGAAVAPIPVVPDEPETVDAGADTGVADAGPAEAPEEIAATEGTVTKRNGRVWRILEGQHAATKATPLRPQYVIVSPLRHEGDFTLIMYAARRNSARFVECLEAVGGSLAHGANWTVAARVATSPRWATANEVTTRPRMNAEQTACIVEMLTQNRDGQEQSFQGEFNLQVTPRE